MPKISVHLEADSPEEFRALLAAFQTERWDTWKPEPKADMPPDGTVITAPEEVQLQPAAEPAQPRRGRPRKEKADKPVGPAAEPAVGVVLPEPGMVHEGGQAEAEAKTEPEAKSEPVKAKPAKAKEPEIVVSRQDLLDAFSEYVQRYGASFGFSDISSLLQKNLGDGVRKASDVPEAQLQMAIGAIKSAINDNPFNRKRDYA